MEDEPLVFVYSDGHWIGNPHEASTRSRLELLEEHCRRNLGETQGELQILLAARVNELESASDRRPRLRDCLADVARRMPPPVLAARLLVDIADQGFGRDPAA